MNPIKNIFNAVIYCINLFMYFAHLEGQKFSEKYDPYDFSQDIQYWT